MRVNSMQIGLISCAIGACSLGHAQTSSLQVYGNVDLGLSYVSNTAGSSTWKMDSGISKPSRLGFRGSEDLGDGRRAGFVLESGLNVDAGTIGDASAYFSREASLSISTPTLGSVRLGRMTDFFLGDLDVLDSTPLVQGGMTAGLLGYSRPFGEKGAAPGVSLHYPGAKFNNSIKWMREFGPIRAGLMYGFGAENSNDKMYSAMLRYANGDFRIGAAYTKDNYTKSLFARETYALKASYRDGKMFYFSNYGVGKDPLSKAKTAPMEIGFQYSASPQWRIGAGIGYAWVTNEIGRKAHISQPFFGAKYLLSKRTELYSVLALNRTSDKSVAGATVGVPGGAPNVSTSSSMNVLRIGVLHNF